MAYPYMIILLFLYFLDLFSVHILICFIFIYESLISLLLQNLLLTYFAIKSENISSRFPFFKNNYRIHNTMIFQVIKCGNCMLSYCESFWEILLRHLLWNFIYLVDSWSLSTVCNTIFDLKPSEKKNNI